MENWNLNNLYVEIGRENLSFFKDICYILMMVNVYEYSVNMWKFFRKEFLNVSVLIIFCKV